MPQRHDRLERVTAVGAAQSLIGRPRVVRGAADLQRVRADLIVADLADPQPLRLDPARPLARRLVAVRARAVPMRERARVEAHVLLVTEISVRERTRDLTV